MDKHPRTRAQPSSAKKPRRRWHQFSLATLLIFVTLLGCALGLLCWKVHEARQQCAAVGEIVKLGGYAVYDYQLDSDGVEVGTFAAPRGPAWLRAILGDDFFRYVAKVDLAGSDVTDARLESLYPLTRLEYLVLSHTHVTDAGVERLERFKHLRELELSYTEVTDAGLHSLARLSELEQLSLESSKITDAGLKHLKALTRLVFLDLDETQVADAGLTQFEGMTQLHQLWLPDTTTESGVAKLQKALPSCQIVCDRSTGLLVPPEKSIRSGDRPD